MSETSSLHRLVADVVESEDPAVALRLVSLLHRRGVLISELRLDGASTSGSRCFTVVFRSTEARARLVQAGYGSVVGVLRTALDVDVCERA